MFNELIQSDWFWPTVGISLLGYYAWVILTYFRSGFLKRIPFLNPDQTVPKSKTKLMLSWDELAMGFALHRRLLADPHAVLDAQESMLLGRSPFKELIQQLPTH